MPRLVLRLLPLVTVLAALAANHAAAQAPALPAYDADASQTTVSGLSSGAFMAEQFAVAYSSTVIGAGLVAGGPYGCSTEPGTSPYIPYLTNALTVCENPASYGVQPPDAATLWKWTKQIAHNGAIDDTANLKRQKIYLYTGTDDATVTRAVVDQTLRFHQLAGVPAQNVRYVTNIPSGHGIITSYSGDVACASTAAPYINNCGFLQSQDILNTLYAGLNPPAATTTGSIVAFNQRSFVQGSYSSMNNTAYAYVPKSCGSQRCRVHIVFHGCYQTTADIGDHFYAHTGYNELADTNNIIVLYPQISASPVYPYNPRGCWDFWGYTSVDPFLPDFYARTGVQMAAVKAMLDRLAAPRGSH